MIPGRYLVAALAAGALGLLPGTATAGVPAWTTYRHDGARSGSDPDSSSPVAPAQIWRTPALDGSIYGQPLVYRSLVFVATENDTVYALDASTGAIVWQKHLATAVNSGALPCGDISPTVGITSTPVIDPSTDRIYVVADTWDGSHANTIAHEMYALNLSDGSLADGPAPVDPPGAPAGDTPANQLQRTSLAIDAGKVIIGYGGNAGDCNTYHGWLVAAPEGGGPLQAFEVDSQPGDDEGAIWGAGNAPVIDSAGDVWISTGNGNSTSFDNQESVIKLDPNMNILDWWAPSNWATLDASDADLGSSMPLLLPDGLVFEIGKGGLGYLLNAASLGKTGAAPVYSQNVCGGSWGGAIYSGGVIYVTCSNGLHALALNPTARTFTALSGWTVNGSANGPPTIAGGLVWSVNWNGATLYGLNPATGATAFSASLSGFEHFTTPSAAGGRLFVANHDASGPGDDVTAFQIATAPGPSATALTLASSTSSVPIGEAITLTATVAPAPDAGTVAFADGGAPISGCAAVPVSVVTGRASCTTAFSRAGSHAILASYSGDSYYQASAASLSQSVLPAGGGLSAPAISRLHVRVVHGKLRLSLSLSERAKLTVRVARLLPGHFVHRRCRPGRRGGRRCQAAVLRRTIRLAGRKGANALRPHMRALPPGRYRVTVTAFDAAGRRSRARTAVVVVKRSRR